MRTVLKKIFGEPWYKKILVWCCTFFITTLLVLLAVDCNLFNLFGRSPSLAEIKNPVVNEASEIYSADGVLLGRYFSENRTPVTYEEISPIIIRTLIDTEDERFYKHHGIDYIGLISAARDITHRNARGASTITQQLAKNMFRVRTKYSTGTLGNIAGLKLVIVKLKEWIVAFKLEMTFSKEEILTMYLNTVDFGSNSYGIKTACRTYFGTTPDKITYDQAAILIGLLKATSSYNPKLNPENCKRRRNIVLDLVYQHNHIFINNKLASAEQLDSIKALPIKVESRPTESSYDGLAPYFREALVDYIDMLHSKRLIPGFDENNKLDLYADGLKIYSTLDSRMQKYAEESAEQEMRSIQQRFDEHWGSTNPWQDRYYREIPGFIERIAKKTAEYKYLKSKFKDNEDSIFAYLNKPHDVNLFSHDGPIAKQLSTMDSIRYMVRFMHCGFIAMEPDTRHVKAWVGDVDFNSWKYDKVTALRQPGSTFKLFVYTEGMNQGLSPCSKRLDSFVAYPDTTSGKPGYWTPHNADGQFTNAEIPLKTAFAKSINSIAIKVGLEVGIPNIVKTAHKMGIQSPLQSTKSLCLGSSDVNLLELTNSYCTVVNDGKFCMPILITKIEDREGNLIYEAQTSENQAIPYRSAYLMQMMLRTGILEYRGTTAYLWNYIRPFAKDTDFGGKTGTSNNHSDAWFVGVTPKLVAGAWVGGEYRSIHFRTGELGQGSRTALPIYGNFIQKVFSDEHFIAYRQRFAEPQRLNVNMWSCSGNYILPPDSMTTDF